MNFISVKCANWGNPTEGVLMVPFSLYPSQEYSCGMAFRKPNQIPLCVYGSISVIPTNTIFPFFGWWTSINPSCSDVGTGWCSPSPDKSLVLFRNGGMFQVCTIYIYIYIHCAYMFVYIYIYTVTTFKYVEGGPDREAPEVVWNTSSYI